MSVRTRMSFRIVSAVLTAAAITSLSGPATAASCRAQQIMTSQCTWFTLEEIGGSASAAARAQQEATSDLVGGCSQGTYQMVLLRGTGLSDVAVQRLKARGVRDEQSVRAECAAVARQVAR